jgi:tetratricopeptide (TPR) repeat protein
VSEVERLRESTAAWIVPCFEQMAAAPVYELPPVSVLSAVGSGAASALAAAEEVSASGNHARAAELLDALWHDVRHDSVLALRQRLALATALTYTGDLETAATLLEHAETLVASPGFDATHRADMLFRKGCLALKRSDVADATSFFTRALELNAGARRPRLVLESQCREWRSRCHQVARDWDAAARDAECALECATVARDDRAKAAALVQASLVAERRRDWLVAQYYAERALDLARTRDDRLSVARILNNLGGIRFLLGDASGAEASLIEAIETADAAGSDADFAQAVSSLAQVYLRTGRADEARIRALRAVEVLTGRVDFRDELGNAQLVVAQSFAASGDDAGAHEWLDAAELTFTEIGATSDLANVWIARGDVVRPTDCAAAADVYRRAADILRDVHF